MRATAVKATVAFLVVLVVVLAVAGVGSLVTADSGEATAGAQIQNLDHEQYSVDRFALEDDPGQASIEMDSNEPNGTVVIHVGPGSLERNVRPLVNVLTENDHDVEIVGDGRGGADVARALGDADAFVSVGAGEYRSSDIDAIESLADDGGRVVVLAEPQQLFSERATAAELQNALGLYAEPGYVYNLGENDRNYQRIFVEPDGDDALTAGVDRAVFELATPVDAVDGADLLGVTDGTTLSTTRAETDAAVMVRDGNVVLAGDAEFLTPENTLRADNDVLLGNLADFLVTGDRTDGGSGDRGGPRDGERNGTVETVTVGPGGEPVFEPQILEIEPGTTVRFEWATGGYNLAVVFQPDGASWEGVPGVREEGYVHEFTFEQEGVYEFVSEPHQELGMSGAIVVGDPRNIGR